MRDQDGRRAPIDGCAWTDAVIARALDGDVDAAAALGVGDAELAGHERTCPVCAAALRRCRRLDALVATTGRDEPDDGQLRSWLERAVVAPRPDVPATAAVPGAAGAPRWRRALAAAALVTIGALVGALLARSAGRQALPRPGPAEPVARDATVQGAEGEPARPPVADAGLPRGAVLLTPDDGSAPRRGAESPERVRSAAARLAVAAERVAGPRLELAALAVATVTEPRWTGLPAAAARRAAAVRQGVAAQLVRAGADDVDVFRVALAHLTDADGGPLPDAIARAARGSDRFVGRLARELRGAPPEPRAPWAAAVRIGAPALDAALRARAAGDREVVELLVRELRTAPGRPGLGRLLLAVVTDATRRGLVDPEELVPRAFAGLDSAGIATEVVAALDASRNAGDRRIALRALGELRDLDTAAGLRDILCAPRLEEAELAAWALGRLPVGADDLALARVPDARRPLWLAVLASRGEPIARKRIAGLQLSDEERDFLLAGGFSPAQLGVAAALLRRQRWDSAAH
ncbi:MAG: hypothetical protein IPM29_19160 [Planctomycetes bacterium]|nr:hypothetical protein [Planctomycetota bacterium]